MSNVPSLRDFSSIVFFTGAGLSAESGIPTYRGKGGIWGKYNYEDYACQDAFDRDPDHVWDFHELRREKIASCNPNGGHETIAAIQAEKPDTKVVTQNIDGLLQRAGVQNPIELHGSMWRLRCSEEGHVIENFDVPLASRRCECGAYWRPDIVWFGDSLSEVDMQAAENALVNADCLVSIGTSAAVYPAAALPRIAMETGAVSIEINLEDTPMTPYYQHAIRARATDALAQLWNA